ncbi:hypothetical protein [Phenylobacterium sp.]|jgi:hypothetical protein|uniref:hypothetical protein n=1 Tax=Phenylobacterium sp. TaxID=1871053 RepID=UPI0037CABD56
MKSWLKILIDRAAWIARLPYVKLKALDARIVRTLEAWDPWPRLPRRKPKKHRKHGPGWISPKAMMAAIASELVPAALASGWVRRERQPGRKGERRLGEFEFERVSADRVESLGFDYQYGDQPDVWIRFSLRLLDKDGVGPTFWTGNCANYSDYRKPLWRQWIDWLHRAPAPLDPLAFALERGLDRFEIVEEFFRTGALHRDFNIYSPQVRWRRDGTAKVLA